MKLSSKQTFFVLVAVNCLLVIGIFGLAYEINSILSQQSKALVDKRLQIQSLDAQTSALTAGAS